MSLFPLDAVRNAVVDRRLEVLLEELREDLLRHTFSGQFASEDVLDAFEQSRPRLNVMLSLLTAAGAQTVLDVGTGLGFLPVLLRRIGIHVTATERDPSVSEYAHAHGVSVVRHSIGASPLPVASGAFDAVVLGEVLEHLKVPPVRALTELLSPLRSGGHLLLTTPNVARLAHLEALAAGENFLEPFPESIPAHTDATDWIEHIREYSISEVVDAVEGAGLEIESVQMTGWGESGYAPLPNPYANEIIVVWASKAGL